MILAKMPIALAAGFGGVYAWGWTLPDPSAFHLKHAGPALLWVRVVLLLGLFTLAVSFDVLCWPRNTEATKRDRWLAGSALGVVAACAVHFLLRMA